MSQKEPTFNFITNQPLDRMTGGWCGISRGLYSALAKIATVNFVGPVDPRVSWIAKAISKSDRVLGRPGNFHFFSEDRLERIAKTTRQSAPAADADLFFGATPWIACDLGRPYATYIDALFPSYMEIFSTPTQFKKRDLLRIQEKEAKWLNAARHIFWTSDWARRDGAKFDCSVGTAGTVVGVGGNLVPPAVDSYQGEKRILFLSMRFKEKGGMEAFEAFRKIYRDWPEFSFVVIGDDPPSTVAQHPNVEVLGMLDKSNSVELERLRRELSRTFCVIHPTRMDTMGCVLIEAAYWGCPCIAPTRFGIPEIVQDKVTGLLLPEPFSVNDIVHRVRSLVAGEDAYSAMRRATRSRALKEFTYEAIAERVLATMQGVLSV